MITDTKSQKCVQVETEMADKISKEHHRCMKLEAALINKENEVKMKSKEVADLQRKLSQLKGKTDQLPHLHLIMIILFVYFIFN